MKPNEMMKKRILGMIILLCIQFVLGMFLNLFGISPDDAAAKGQTEPMYSTITFALHGISGLLLLLGSVVVTFFSIKAKNDTWKSNSIYGLLSILLAFVAGITTITFKETASEISSYIMSLGFLLSFIFYGRFLQILKG